MKFTSVVISFYFICNFSSAQNLVPNGDFELMNSCPTMKGEITSAASWVNNATLSPDYYNVCNIEQLGVPINLQGYQPAHSGGAYAGIFVLRPMRLRMFVSTSAWL